MFSDAEALRSGPDALLTLTPGAHIGPFEIISALGVGGMGEVYRARDTRLGREVAIKVLLPAVASDPERLARFSREAHVLASLNHPNIAHIHGLEEANGITALVLELVEGPTLADRIATGPIPLDEALAIARQIAEALEAAHEQGIIHRDLKPANIKVRFDGTVKVLDFGLAKAMEPASALHATPGQAGLSQSPTIMTPVMTEAGVILGTAAYMSPEQARGGVVDKRADLWAFGAVLYEMMTAKRPFEGATVSDTLAAVLRGEPDWTALPRTTRTPIRTLLRRCLAKDRKQRLDSASAARLEIEGALKGPEETIAPAKMPTRRLAMVAASTLAGGALVAAFAMWFVMRPTLVRPPPVMRFAVVTALPQAPLINGADRDLALSPDGTHLVYVSGSASGTQLMVRAMDRLDAVPLGGITGIRSPFISPDGLWVGFFAGNMTGEIRKVSIAGGPSVSLCRFQGTPRGASWGPDGTIIFATSDPTTGLFSVPEAGGEPSVLTKPEFGRDHVFPSVLPGGRAVLFTIAAANLMSGALTPGSIAAPQVAVLDLKTGQRKTLVSAGGYAEYADRSSTSTIARQIGSDRGGYLVYGVAGTLRAVHFDPVTLDVLGDPVPVVDHVMTMANGAAEFSLSREGALAYVVGGPFEILRSLVWVDRHGQEEPIKAPPRAYYLPRLSPDGTRLALDTRDQESDIWIWEFARQTLRRLTMDPALDWYPVWTPDGGRVMFSSSRAGAQNLFSQAADNTGTAERLTTSPNFQFPTSISPDGTRLIFYENSPKTGPDLRVLRMDGAKQIEPLVETTFTEHNGEISPDGHWLAYESNESGQFQIHVRPFPHVESATFQISTGGGTKPVWARSGRELFYFDGSNSMTVVPVQTTPTFTYGNPTRLFDGRYFSGPPGRTYDVSPDGTRFLMIKDGDTANPNVTPASMVIVLNWSEELKRLVPTR